MSFFDTRKPAENGRCVCNVFFCVLKFPALQ
nr:MAG TPA: Potassium channel toxin alpha-KTx 9.4-2, Scorpion Toxin, Kv1.1, Disulfide [Bacteriophage sp.]